MGKILVVFNENNYQTLPEILRIVKECSCELHGIFLKHCNLSADFNYPFLNDLCFAHASLHDKKNERQSNEYLLQNIEMVRNACAGEGINFKATIYDNPCLDQLIAHTASADLLLLGASLNFREYFTSSVNVCLKDILSKLHCPVQIFHG